MSAPGQHASLSSALLHFHSEPSINRRCSRGHQDHSSRFGNRRRWRRRRRAVGIAFSARRTTVSGARPRASRNGTADRKRDESAGRSKSWQSRRRRSNRNAGIKLQKSRSQVPGHLLNAAGHRIRAVQFRLGRFFGSGFCSGQDRDLVPAAGAGRDTTVGQQLLPLVQADLLTRPVHVIATAVGEINPAGALDPNDAGAAVIESFVVLGDRGIVRGHLAKLSS